MYGSARSCVPPSLAKEQGDVLLADAALHPLSGMQETRLPSAGR